MGNTPSALQIRLAEKIVSLVRMESWQTGHHLTEDALSDILVTSRTPVRGALIYLAEADFLERRPQKGFYVKNPEINPFEEKNDISAADENDIYQKIALDRLRHTLPDTVSMSELVRRYNISRARMLHVLTRIASEGWAERRSGNGWAFQTLIDNVDAYKENYLFRATLEPAFMRSEDFYPDDLILLRLKEKQEFVKNEGYKFLSSIEFFQIDAEFHETLATMTGNRFFIRALKRANQLRRLMEYGLPPDRKFIQRVCLEHIAVINALLNKNIKAGATLLKNHITKGMIFKSHSLMSIAKEK
ncbi:GntR family transcriptional regulator [Acetobacter thailandicus]|uniref:GntR family transcriptional regulator n=1 Tax=Acetobacter thailandicus TaxID=1502842 RepID=UPI001BA4EF7C|nr:GntR family transcriptional regulator [Acetobacter thailandicus]MBS0960630.1 GntR family transcriptional regulator [Acetobacter thailandicus]